MIQKRYVVKVPHSHWESDGNGGGRRIDDEPSQEEVDIDIDIDAIISRLGPKACQNKGGVSKYLNGRIVIRRVKS